MKVIDKNAVKLNSPGGAHKVKKTGSVVIKRTPMWLWTMRLMPSRPSRSGVGEPEVTKAAPVRGTRPAASRRSNVQW